MSNETKTKYQVKNSQGEVIATRNSKRAYTHAVVVNDSAVYSLAGSYELAHSRSGDIWITYEYGKGAVVAILPVEAVETKVQTKVNCPLCNKLVKLNKNGLVSRHKSAHQTGCNSHYTGCEFTGLHINTPLTDSLLRSRIEAGVALFTGGSFPDTATKYRKELKVINQVTPGEETPVEETPVEETPGEEEARCYHVTRCKFDPRGNPAAWSTDSSYATLEEARARCAELVAELGGEVDPSSLSAHSCETVGDVGIQLVYDTLPARDNTKTYVGAHNGAYLYETSPIEEEETPVEEAPRCSVCGSTAKVTKWGAVYKHYNKLSQQVGYCKGSGKIPAVETSVEPLVKGLPAPAEEEARVIRVTVPQVDALRALGYEVKSCKLRYYPSQVEEMLERLYVERETRTRGARRVYTSLIERVSGSKRSNSPTQAHFKAGDLNITYTSKSALAQLMQLIDTAERGELISKASASALRTSCTHQHPEVKARPVRTHLPPEVKARPVRTHLPPEVDECTTSEALARFFRDE